MFSITEIEKIKITNGSTLLVNQPDFNKDMDEYCYIIDIIRNFMPYHQNDKNLLIAYYTNENLIQDYIRLEFKRKLIENIDSVVVCCIRKGNLKISNFLVKQKVFKYFDIIFSDFGLFNEQMCWFFNNLGVFNVNFINEIIEYINE